jgi:tRNA(Ile)-lysidine synthase
MHKQLAHFLAPYLTRSRRVWIALSGGLDSMALLDMCVQLHHPNALLCPVHINHGVNSQAEAWRAHCEAAAARYGLTLTSTTLQLHFQAGDSKEAVMRQARYDALGVYMAPEDLLFTAHHADDQAETLLLQLLRGAGVDGLAAMPAVAPFASGLLLRPLLTYSRADLLAYAEQKQLQWVEDDSNQNLQFDRNFLRHTILPLLKNRWPSVATTLTRSSQHCGEAKQLLDKLAQQQLTWLQQELPQRCLSLSRLQTLDDIQQRLVLRAWFKQNQVVMPSEKKLAHIQTDILAARPDAQPCVTWWGGKKDLQRALVSIRRYRDTLFLQAEVQRAQVKSPVVWDLTAPLQLPEQLGSLSVVLSGTTGLSVARLQAQSVTVRFRPQVSTSLQKMWQQVGVPPWLRNYVPLIYSGERLAAVVGYWQDKLFNASPAETGITIEWKPN